MFYDRRNCKTERFVALPTREERRGKEVQAKENQSKVQSEKFPAQEQERMKDDHDIVYQSLICCTIFPSRASKETKPSVGPGS